MKKQIFLALSFALLVVFGGCNKIKDAIKADVTLTMASINFEIPVTAQGSTVNITRSTSLEVDALIKQSAGSNFGVKNIKSLKITSCELTMLSESDASNSFGNLESCRLELSSSTSSNFTTLAEVANNPEGTSTTLNIPVNSSVDLKDYFNASDFSVKLSGKTRRATTKPLTCKAIIKYTAQVGL